jgi:hypothetical protein
MGPRQGDNAEVARIEWIKPLMETAPAKVEPEKTEKPAKKVTKKAAKTE